MHVTALGGPNVVGSGNLRGSYATDECAYIAARRYVPVREAAASPRGTRCRSPPHAIDPTSVSTDRTTGSRRQVTPLPPPSGRSRTRRKIADETLSSVTADESIYSGIPLAEVLHARAPHAVWRHVWRTVLRVMVLVGVDLLTLELLRIVLSAARDQAWFGSRIAAGLAATVPAGAVPALPLQTAVLLGLAICGGYVGGAKHRD